MSTSSAQERVVSKGDAAALWVYIVLGTVFVVWTAVSTVRRIIEVATADHVRVFAEFAGTRADAPIGPDGAAVPVELSTAYLTASDLPGIVTASLIAEALIAFAAATAVVVCLVLLMASILRGTVFSRRNTRLVLGGTIAALAGIFLAPFFGNMGANGAFAAISERTFDNVIYSIDPVLLWGTAFVGSVAATAFTVGARLQRDTTGLV